MIILNKIKLVVWIEWNIKNVMLFYNKVNKNKQMELFLFDIGKNEIVEFDNETNILDKLYFLQARLPTEKEITEAQNKKIQEYLKKDNYDNLIKKMRIEISKIEEKTPLYDVYTENIYLIKKHNVYSRVMHQHYRFPEKYIIDELIEKKKEYANTIKNIDDKLLLRKIKKINLMIEFMNCFDLDVLFDTYVKIFYKYSSLVGKETTICKNPSFKSEFFHLKPYLTRSEVINSALNFGIKLPDNYIEPDEINKICKKISKFQLNSNVLLEHQHHILNSGSLGLVQFYTLQGSFFMNQYLRNMTDYSSQNKYLEELIKPMWDLVITAPKFDKSYTFYRFVSRDDYLADIKVGDIYMEKGFMSTTRDPFYRADLYKFGFILIKIKVPAGKVGVALCLETISHFPEEQEIIFPPNSKFKLVSRDTDCQYYHTDMNFSSKVKTRYEFEWVENGSVVFDRSAKSNKKEEITMVDFLNLGKVNAITLNEKLKYFDSTFVNNQGQFQINLGEKVLTVMTEWYDGTGAYKKFYAIETKTGYSFYTIYKGYILFYVELGETNEGRQMHVNYYVKYSSVDPSKVIGNDNLIKFFSSIANYFDIVNVVIYANYLNCNTTIVQSGGYKIQRGFETKTVNNFSPVQFNMIGGSYCSDLYQYLSTGIKKYSEDNILNVELQPKFSYHDLNYLKTVTLDKILSKEDRDELYQIYDKYYKNLNNDDNVAKFYVWLIEESKCYLLDTFVQKIDKVLGKNNPFKNDMYLLDPATYLYNRKYINSYPTHININQTIKRDIINENKNDNGTIRVGR